MRSGGISTIDCHGDDDDLNDMTMIVVMKESMETKMVTMIQ